MRKFRLLQKMTGIHRIHHIHWSYGWKIPFVNAAYFDDKFEHMGGKSHGFKSIKDGKYHNCTMTGIY